MDILQEVTLKHMRFCISFEKSCKVIQKWNEWNGAWGNVNARENETDSSILIGLSSESLTRDSAVASFPSGCFWTIIKGGPMWNKLQQLRSEIIKAWINICWSACDRKTQPSQETARSGSGHSHNRIFKYGDSFRNTSSLSHEGPHTTPLANHIGFSHVWTHLVCTEDLIIARQGLEMLWLWSLGRMQQGNRGKVMTILMVPNTVSLYNLIQWWCLVKWEAEKTPQEVF